MAVWLILDSAQIASRNLLFAVLFIMKGLHFYVLLASVAASPVFASHPISWGRRLQPGTAAPPAPPSMGCHGGKAVKVYFYL